MLDALLRQGVDVAYSCRRGTCHSCLLRAEAGRVPETAQAGLRDSLRSQGYFLACQCRPREDMALVRPEDGGLFRRATVMEREDLAPGIAALRLAPPDGFTYSPGQFVNLRRPDGLVRSYSLTAPAARKDHLELHIARQAGGRMSNWLLDCLVPGDEIELAGPNGDCVYMPGNHAQPILMIGTGTGLAPLLGVVVEALDAGHGGPIRLYHGSSRPEGLYCRERFAEIARRHANFTYIPCLSRCAARQGERQGRADSVAFSDHPDLTRWRLYLCGRAEMVHAARQTAFVQGAGLDRISGDAFETTALPDTANSDATLRRA